MPSQPPPIDDGEKLERTRAAVEAALAAPTFIRSPVMSKLLSYLFEKTRQSQTVKSYSIAFDGLGKDSSDGVEADPTPVLRLRA